MLSVYTYLFINKNQCALLKKEFFARKSNFSSQWQKCKDTDNVILAEPSSEQANCKWAQVLPQQRAISAR